MSTTELGGSNVRPLHLALSRAIFLWHVLCTVTRSLMPAGWSGYWSSKPFFFKITARRSYWISQSETKSRPLISDIKWYDQSLFNWRCRASFITFLNLISRIVKSPAEGKLISRWPECLSLKYNAKKWDGSTTINLTSKLRKRSNFLIIWPNFESVKNINNFVVDSIF